MNERLTDITNAPTVLLVEDIPSLRTIYQSRLMAGGVRLLTAGSGKEALHLFQTSEARVVLLDLHLPDVDGMELMQKMLQLRPESAIVVITADRSVDRAVLAMRAGALDFLTKPISEERLTAAVENACASVQLPPPAKAPAQEPAALSAFAGDSAPMREVHTRILSAARTMAPVFLTGENGTGKELCAQTIHALSPRATAPFVTLDCAATPAERFDSEVFGHVRGAFMGAIADHPGIVARADGGTLFLDEICELAPAAQSKLLRFLQSNQYQPLGSTTPHTANIRVIASCSVPPLEAVQAGRLRDELYYRLYVVPIRMPALRERPEDILPLAHDLLHKYATLEGRSFASITEAAAEVLQMQPWPGNVRQLMSVLRAITVLHDGTELRPEMLPDDMARPRPVAGPRGAADAADLQALAGHSLAQIERLAIEAAIARHGDSVPKAARELDVAPSTLYRKIESWRRP